jgi:dihydropteroate synthase
MSPLDRAADDSPQSAAWSRIASHRATSWRLRTLTLMFERRPRVMGILNVTPDSFSDGGRYDGFRPAVDRALQLQADGADLIDIGGESTRPYSTPVTAAEELRRVIPVLERLQEELRVPVSIDTSKAAVAREALAAGAEVINDITGLGGDPEMLPLAIASGAGVCAMHMQGTPQTMQDRPQYDDVVADIFHWLAERRDRLEAEGLDPARLCLDPGIGFGKSHQHNLTLMAGCHRFHALGRPLLVGHSRKGFIGKLLGDPAADRTLGTVGAALALAAQGVQVIRVHDVRPLRDALALFEASGGIDGTAGRLEPTA